MSRDQYDKVLEVFNMVTSWKEFKELVVKGHYKWILFEAIEAGWASRIQEGLIGRFITSEEEIATLIKEYQDAVDATSKTLSITALTKRLSNITRKINELRGYLRYANYTRRDDQDDIIWTIDAKLTELGSGTPTRDECARSYSYITETVVSPGAIVIATKDADTLATYLAGILEEMLRAFPQLVDLKDKESVYKEIGKIDELHCVLTGRRLLASEFCQLLPNKFRELVKASFG